MFTILDLSYAKIFRGTFYQLQLISIEKNIIALKDPKIKYNNDLTRVSSLCKNYTGKSFAQRLKLNIDIHCDNFCISGDPSNLVLVNLVNPFKKGLSCFVFN